jgi:type I restriction enzyme, S subunit
MNEVQCQTNVDAGLDHKWTEAGVIPNEWNVKPLADVLEFTNGKAHEPYVDEQGAFVLVNSKFVSTEGRVRKHCHKNFCPTRKEDILLVMSDLPNGKALAKCFLADQDGTYAVNQRIARLRSKGDHAQYLFYTLNRHPFFLQFDDGGQQTHLSKATILGCPLVIPSSTEEQRAIAAALSDVDALITSLDKLIAKKRDMKQGAIQELLNGNRRLPGFTEIWEEKSLSEVCLMKSGEGITSTNIDDFSKYPCYGGNGLRGFTSRYTHGGSYALIGRQGALCGNVLLVEGCFFASEHAIVVTALPGSDIRWLTYVLRRMNLNQYSESSAQPGLSVSKILNLRIAIPPTKAEQTAIATILSDMDAEITALERKRDKTRALKQGMMQELLTGRIRLV